ncbi:nitroreductase family protein [Myxococcota bacterium]|nr:nitroreductase family protein [Myxococcota bacterium]
MDIFEAMETCRAMRYLRPDPVPDELIDKLLWAATRAPSPGNSQGWEFVVVRDRDVMSQIGELVGGRMTASMGGLVDTLPPSQARLLRGALHLANTLPQVPALFVVCSRRVYPPQDPQEVFVWSCVYPAAQNLILAARALGLGSTFATWQTVAETELREILGIPEDVFIGATIPVGYPERDFGPVARRPVAEVVHHDHW